MTGFHDHFGGHAAAYARHRPDYPDALYVWLAEQCPTRRLAWDCGTGNGQAAVGLARYFDEVIGTDASAGQIAAAAPHPRVSYRVAPAERCPLADASADLVTVAQALHWFDRPAFFAEVDRVLRPGGLLAAWTYALFQVDPEVDRLVWDFYERVVGTYWPPERVLVARGYADIELPFPVLDPPTFSIEQSWGLTQALDYVATWSAVKRAEAAGENPLPWLRRRLAPIWTDLREVRWSLALRACRKPA